MNYTEILKALNTASLFDLHRLQSAIYQELTNPERLAEIKNRLKPGQMICYFDPEHNGQIEAIVIQGKKTKCLVEHVNDGHRWNIPFYYINLDEVNTDIQPTKQQTGIEKAVLKVGDRVGFLNRELNEEYGEVIRLNPKTATIKIDQLLQWRVSYSLLFPVLDGEHSEQKSVQEFLPGSR